MGTSVLCYENAEFSTDNCMFWCHNKPSGRILCDMYVILSVCRGSEITEIGGSNQFLIEG